MMQQFLFSLAPTLTVAQLVRQIKDVVESDDVLRDLWVRGEISNFTQSAAGHLYFTLKDRDAAIKCVMWRADAARVFRLPNSGDAIEAHGRVSMYEARGDLQLYVDEIKLTGAGALWQEFERLKTRLEAEGLFAPEHKRALPEFPRVIGVVTSRDGAVLRDIRNVLARRYPLAEILLAPTLVQGDAAPTMIVGAIQALNEFEIDVLIVARGGGSIEDLWAFNDERVARAIYDSRVPVISAVGHETDFTIADFVADVRAPTPSAAAELVAPDARELRGNIRYARQQLTHIATTQLDDRRARLIQIAYALKRNSPQARLANDRQRVDDLSRRLGVRARQIVALRREMLSGAARHLAALNPDATLARGYAIVREKKTGRVVRVKSQAAGRKEIRVRVSDGEFEAT
ncbi:MAG: exodeoxyribonuclease VII large subunit, partial [Anaerolineales bacterium]|nr:exodeoxyribonuclease VII large subunit [Anaerolineales bacterium]